MENQTTMFDTQLSKAADSFIEAHRAVDRWKETKEKAIKDLINEMKRCNMLEIQLTPQLKVSYEFVDAQEKLRTTKTKPKGERSDD